MMYDRLYARDEQFDYLRAPLPSELEMVLGDQTQRARLLLTNRSAAELDYGFDSLDWILREATQLFAADLLAGKYGPEAFINRAKALRAFMPRVSLVGQSAFPNATWPEYFAALALANVGEQLYSHAKPLEASQFATADDLARQRTDAVVAAALESMEAVCFAEQLSEASAPLREAGKKGGQVRAERFNTLREKLLAYYDANLTRHSNRQAAKRLHDQFEIDVAATLRSDDPVHQIEKWIGSHRKRAKAET